MGSECGFGPCGCICSDFQGHGRLQCLCLGGRPKSSEQVVFDSECSGCKCGSEGVLRVQGCGGGCAAVNRLNIQTSLENYILTINKVCLFMSYDTMDYISFVIWYWEGNNGVVKCKN